MTVVRLLTMLGRVQVSVLSMEEVIRLRQKRSIVQRMERLSAQKI